MSSRLIFIVSALVLGASVALAQEEEETFVPTTVEELVDAIGETMAEHEVPAVGLALVDASGPVWVGSLGKAVLETDKDANADTLFRIGSTSKMFVALSVLQLVEAGRLSLDDKLADLAPEVEFKNPWEDTDPIRVAHLLEHTTGWDDIHLPEYAHSDPKPATLKEGLDYHPHSRSSRWKPGTRSSYCNAGPPVAAYIVQKITGQDFEDYVAENFFAPLQMNSATYRLSEGMKQNGATLYTDGVAEEYWHIIMRPSGSINASPNDMAALLRLFLGLFGRGAERLGELLPRRSESKAIRASLMFYLTLGRSPAPNWYAHNPLWKSLYLVLLVALAASVATGATMVNLPLLGGLYLPSVHRWLASLVGLLTLAHLYSVVLQDIKGRNADISAMFSGQRLFFVERTEPGRPGVTPVAIRPDEIKRAQDSQRQG